MRGLNAAAASAGLTAFIWYACGALPLQLAVVDQLAFSSGSVFIVWAGGAVASIVLSLSLKQPIPITWSYANGVLHLSDGTVNLDLDLVVGAGGRVLTWAGLSDDNTADIIIATRLQ